MNFFRKVKDSIYNPEFYKSLPLSKTGSAISYFVILVLFLSLIQTALLALPTFTAMKELTNKTLPKLIASYPDNLEVRIKDGIATTNVSEPYYFPIRSADVSVQTKNFLVIDTKDPYSAKEFSDFSTVALLTADSLYYQQNQNGIIKSIPLKNAGNITINQQFLDQQLSKYSPLLKMAAPIILLIIFAVLFIFYILRLVYNLFLAAVIYLISRVTNSNLSYGQSYKVGIYAMTLGLLVEVLLRLISPLVHLPAIPFMVTIISAVVFVVNFKSEPKS